MTDRVDVFTSPLNRVEGQEESGIRAGLLGQFISPGPDPTPWTYSDSTWKKGRYVRH